MSSLTHKDQGVPATKHSVVIAYLMTILAGVLFWICASIQEPPNHADGAVSLMPWILISLTIAIGIVGLCVSWHYIVDGIKLFRIRRKPLPLRLIREAHNSTESELILPFRSDDGLLGGQDDSKNHTLIGACALSLPDDSDGFAGLRLAPQTLEHFSESHLNP